MAKKPFRKPKRRAPYVVVHEWDAKDPALAELAEVIAENTLECNASGWFELPWRDGWNAAELALRGWERNRGENEDSGLKAIEARLVKWTREDRFVSPSIYEQAQADLGTCSAIYVLGDRRRYLMSSLRCVQLVIANSHGGGRVFNDVLKLAFVDNDPNWIADIVREYRCLDAIGVKFEQDNTINDRLRRAFKTAWDRGLFHAAYSLPQAKRIS